MHQITSEAVMRAYFTELVGNEYTKRRLFEAVRTNTLPHAHLIVGPKGSGRLTLARELAAAMNCDERENESVPLPCGRCNTCRRIREGIFPDVQIVTRGSGKATIGVEDIKAMREDVYLSSTEAEYKFYIVREAEAMTPQAQNALLKVFEEPPKNVHIILISTEADKILTTVKSRSQYVQTEIFDPETLKRYTVRRSERAGALARTDSEKLDAVILSAGGVIGNALAMLDDSLIAEQTAKRETVTRLISAFSKKESFGELLSACTSLPQKREELRSVLELTLTALRDMISHEYSENTQKLFFTSKQTAEKFIGSTSARRLTKIFDIITRALEDLEKNVSIPPLLTDIAVKIKEA